MIGEGNEVKIVFYGEKGCILKMPIAAGAPQITKILPHETARTRRMNDSFLKYCSAGQKFKSNLSG
jgi:hypothetical protein